MDISLRTGDPRNGIELLEIVREDGGWSFGMRLVVRSDGLAADRPFWIERLHLAELLTALKAMDRTLTGSARLQGNEPDRVTLEATRTGAIVVAGEIGIDPQNWLRFSFATDQTCLKPLVSDLERLLSR
ncbi:MAG TPA: hypothetical protein VFH27_04285 [Longimicrobiaceae bacterium]|nr:hypothetical protein [Longimicrobiaceae bacterium]